MSRFKVVLPSVLAAALLLSLLFVNGSIAQPLGAGLLEQVGISSGGASGGGGAQDDAYRFGLPVTVMNDDSQAVPVTVQGSSTDPLKATIDGTVSTQDVNDPTAQPFQANPDIEFDQGSLNSSSGAGIVVDPHKRLIIHYVSGTLDLLSDQTATLHIQTQANGVLSVHVIPPAYDAPDSATTHKLQYGLDTWIEADPGTSVYIFAERNDPENGGLAVLGGTFAISGYLVDVPTTP